MQDLNSKEINEINGGKMYVVQFGADRRAKLGMNATMMLFGLNGGLFVIWSETLASEERFANATEYWTTFSILP